MIEVRGVNTHNKGAHLMMLAIADAISHRVDLSVSPNGSRYAARASAGYYQTLVLNQAPRLSSQVGNLLPRSLRSAYGLTAEKDVSAVLDASGFAYSDSFPATRARREAELAARWVGRGAPLVLLPQAFGPFENAEQRRHCSRLLGMAKIVYARDAVSRDHVERLGLDVTIRTAPDFTVGLEPADAPAAVAGPFGALVPNQKIVTSGRMREPDYISVLVTAGREMQAAGLAPAVVIHEFSDRRIGGAVSSQLGCAVVESDDPLVLKRALGDAEVAVASRFHAIVSALSCGTPVAALGWSHKYAELMADFGVPEWVVSGDGDVVTAVRSLLAAGPLREALTHRAAQVKTESRRMWSEVLAVVTAG